jgi:hypothetical protein
MYAGYAAAITESTKTIAKKSEISDQLKLE